MILAKWMEETMRLYNSKTQTTEEFSLRDSEITLYVCGITPYDTTHIGHAFNYNAYDQLIRYLEIKGILCWLLVSSARFFWDFHQVRAPCAGYIPHPSVILVNFVKYEPPPFYINILVKTKITSMRIFILLLAIPRNHKHKSKIQGLGG